MPEEYGNKGHVTNVTSPWGDVTNEGSPGDRPKCGRVGNHRRHVHRRILYYCCTYYYPIIIYTNKTPFEGRTCLGLDSR